MTAKNDITGDAIASRPSSDAYRDGWDAIFKPTKPACGNCEKCRCPDKPVENVTTPLDRDKI